MHIRIALFIVFMVISLPLFALYVVIITLLALRQEFSTSFYTMFIFSGVLDLIYFTMNLLCYYLPVLPEISQFFARFQSFIPNPDWRPEYTWMISIANTLMYYLHTALDITNLLVSLNRFLALIFPLMYNMLFTRVFTFAMIILTLLLSFTSCFVTIGAPGFFVNMGSTSEPIYMMHADSTVYFPTIDRSALVSSHMFACNGLCCLIYSIIAAHVFRARVVNSNELRLFLLGFLILVTNAPSIAYQAYWSIFQSKGSPSAFLTITWAIMIKTLAPPLLLLLTNTGMRREILLLLPRKINGAVKETTARDLTIASA